MKFVHSPRSFEEVIKVIDAGNGMAGVALHPKIKQVIVWPWSHRDWQQSVQKYTNWDMDKIALGVIFRSQKHVGSYGMYVFPNNSQGYWQNSSHIHAWKTQGAFKKYSSNMETMMAWAGDDDLVQKIANPDYVPTKTKKLAWGGSNIWDQGSTHPVDRQAVKDIIHYKESFEPKGSGNMGPTKGLEMVRAPRRVAYRSYDVLPKPLQLALQNSILNFSSITIMKRYKETGLKATLEYLAARNEEERKRYHKEGVQLKSLKHFLWEAEQIDEGLGQFAKKVAKSYVARKAKEHNDRYENARYAHKHDRDRAEYYRDGQNFAARRGGVDMKGFNHYTDRLQDNYKDQKKQAKVAVKERGKRDWWRKVGKHFG